MIHFIKVEDFGEFVSLTKPPSQFMVLFDYKLNLCELCRARDITTKYRKQTGTALCSTCFYAIPKEARSNG